MLKIDGPSAGAAPAIDAPRASLIGLWIYLLRLRLDPTKALVGGIFRFRVQPRRRFAVRHLLEKPILVVIALADGVSDVVGEQQRIAQAPAPEPVVVAVAFEEFVAGAIWVADFPNLLAVAHWLPVKFAKVQILSGLDSDVWSVRIRRARRRQRRAAYTCRGGCW